MENRLSLRSLKQFRGGIRFTNTLRTDIESVNYVKVVNMNISHDPTPLRAAADGAITVAGTNILLEQIISAFKCGAATGEIVARFPELNLADAYTVIGYYLRHQPEVDTYLRQRLNGRTLSHNANAALAGI